MRTTLNIDDDLLRVVKERARREKRSTGAVLSELARQGLAGQPPRNQAKRRHGFRPLPHRGAVVSNALIDRLRED